MEHRQNTPKPNAKQPQEALKVFELWLFYILSVLHHCSFLNNMNIHTLLLYLPHLHMRLANKLRKIIITYCMKILMLDILL